MRLNPFKRTSSILMVLAGAAYIFACWWDFTKGLKDKPAPGTTPGASFTFYPNGCKNGSCKSFPTAPTMAVLDPDGNRNPSPEKKSFTQAMLNVSPRFEPRPMYPDGDYPFYYRIKITQRANDVVYLKGTWIVDLTVKRDGKVVKRLQRATPGLLEQVKIGYLNLVMPSDTLPELGEYELSATLYAFPGKIRHNEVAERLKNNTKYLHAHLEFAPFKTKRVKALPENYYTLKKDMAAVVELKEYLQSVTTEQRKTIFVDRDGKQTVKSVSKALHLDFTSFPARNPNCDFAYEVWGISDIGFAKDKTNWLRLGRITGGGNYYALNVEDKFESDAQQVILRLVPSREAAWFATAAFRSFLGTKIQTGWLPIHREIEK